MTNKLDFNSCGIGKYMGQSLIITDLEGVIIYVNEACARLYGYEKDELVGSPPLILNAEKTAERIQEEILKTVNNSNSWNGIVKNKRKDGSTFLCDIHITPLVLDNEVVAYIGVQRDVTEVEEEKRKFKRMLELLDLANNKNGTALVITDDKFNVIYCNRKARKFGCSEEINALEHLGLKEVDMGEDDMLHWEGTVECNNVIYYMRVDALKNSSIHGYSIYMSDNNLRENLRKLSKLKYVKGRY